MQRLITFIFCTNLITVSNGQPRSPRELYGQIFDSVQINQVFTDQKTFVDCLPLDTPEKIVAAYKKQKDVPDFALTEFVRNFFEAPDAPGDAFTTNSEMSVASHIDSLWFVLARQPDTITSAYSSLLPLPYPYIVPGGRFREVYYWDSYFTMLGLSVSRDTAMVHNMIRNFRYLVNQYGFIPNGNRSYYLSRSQPPFFSLMVELWASIRGEPAYEEYLDALVKDYRFWMKGSEAAREDSSAMHVVTLGESVLNRYWDSQQTPREESFLYDIEAAKQSAAEPAAFYSDVRAAAESGWDFSSRWFADGENFSTIQTTRLLPVDLNCLLYFHEKTIAHAYQVTGEADSSARFRLKADERRKAILKYCWNEEERFFCDYNYVARQPSPELSLAGMFPLYMEIAERRQAKKVKAIIKKQFLKEGGVVVTLRRTGEQWDAPNGWAPLVYVTVRGLENYGYHSLAQRIALRWIRLNTEVFENTGKLLEKYNVEDITLHGGGGEYPLQDGFGWTNGVMLKLMAEYGYVDEH